jgi:hypothetical protein
MRIARLRIVQTQGEAVAGEQSFASAILTASPLSRACLTRRCNVSAVVNALMGYTPICRNLRRAAAGTTCQVLLPRYR